MVSVLKSSVKGSCINDYTGMFSLKIPIIDEADVGTEREIAVDSFPTKVGGVQTRIDSLHLSSIRACIIIVMSACTWE